MCGVYLIFLFIYITKHYLAIDVGCSQNVWVMASLKDTKKRVPVMGY